jgi:beta-galactosidase/beta-glucuronidase
MNQETTTVPRPEYPRPQKRRKEWVNLNGEWEFAFDDAGRGFQNGWMDGRKFDGTIIVPFPYQCEASGINDKGVHEVVWYGKSFDFKPEWDGMDLLLHFGAVDYSCTVWINGEEVGSNRGGHVPFWFDIAPYCRPGENRISLRVEDKKDPYQPRGKQSSTGLPFGIDYYCTTGIWQTVWLEPVPPIRVNDLRIAPIVPEKAFELRVFLHAPSADWTVEAEVFDNGRSVAVLKKDICSATARLFIRIPDAELWSPENPKLYDLTVRLYQQGELLDEVDSYVGLRSVELSDGKFMLNGEPVYLKMVLDQGYWPESYMAAPSDEALRADVEWVKKLGYNGARKHQKIEDPRWLHWCDKLGLLVWGEMANARAWSPNSDEMLLAEWQRAVERDYNHPCIVAWVPLNESMGYPMLQEGHPGQYAFVERIVNLTRKADPDRPVIDNDGWEHTDVSDIIAIHDYTPDSKGLIERYKQTLETGELPASTWVVEKPVFTRGSRHWGQPIMLTEVGGFLYAPPHIPKEKLDFLYQCYGSIGSYEELLEKYRDLMKGIAALPFVSGFCYTQLTDVEQEMNGLLTYDRQPKIPVEVIAEIHRTMFEPKREEVPAR